MAYLGLGVIKAHRAHEASEASLAAQEAGEIRVPQEFRAILVLLAPTVKLVSRAIL